MRRLTFFLDPGLDPAGCAGKDYLGCWNKYWDWTQTTEYKEKMRPIVLAPDFLDGNYLSAEFRVPVTLLETNACSPLATNVPSTLVRPGLSKIVPSTRPSRTAIGGGPGKVTPRAAMCASICWSPPSGPESRRSMLRPVLSDSTRPVVPVASKVKLASSAWCATTNPARASFFWSWAISATAPGIARQPTATYSVIGGRAAASSGCVLPPPGVCGASPCQTPRRRPVRTTRPTSSTGSST